MNYPATLTGWQVVGAINFILLLLHPVHCGVSSVHGTPYYSAILVQIFSYNLHKTRGDLTHLTSLPALGSRV